MNAKITEEQLAEKRAEFDKHFDDCRNAVVHALSSIDDADLAVSSAVITDLAVHLNAHLLNRSKIAHDLSDEQTAKVAQKLLNVFVESFLDQAETIIDGTFKSEEA
jgi:hypothetical protein